MILTMGALKVGIARMLDPLTGIFDSCGITVFHNGAERDTRSSSSRIERYGDGVQHVGDGPQKHHLINSIVISQLICIIARGGRECCRVRRKRRGYSRCCKDETCHPAIVLQSISNLKKLGGRRPEPRNNSPNRIIPIGLLSTPTSTLLNAMHHGLCASE